MSSLPQISLLCGYCEHNSNTWLYSISIAVPPTQGWSLKCFMILMMPPHNRKLNALTQEDFICDCLFCTALYLLLRASFYNKILTFQCLFYRSLQFIIPSKYQVNYLMQGHTHYPKCVFGFVNGFCMAFSGENCLYVSPSQ